MPVKVNLRHLEDRNVLLEGELTSKDLEIEALDPQIRVKGTLKYALEAQKIEHSLLVQGRLSLDLDCECVRCLKPFSYPIDLTSWSCHLPLEGEEAVPVISDEVDLTPFLREDIILAFPQHPLCEPECGGLTKPSTTATTQAGFGQGSPAWSVLDKLKLR